MPSRLTLRPAPRRIALAALAGVATLCTPLAAQAHRMWILPNATNFSGEDPWVSVDAAVSNDLFYADHVALGLDQVTAIGPDGSKLAIENGQRGRYRSTFDVHLTQPGTSRIAVVNSNVGGTYVVDGVTYRVGNVRGRPGGAPPGAGAGGPGPGAAPAPNSGVRREGGGGAPGGEGGARVQAQQGVNDVSQIPANATDVKLVQASMRTETFVTRGAPTPIKPTGSGLELVEAGAHPTDAVADEPATFKLMMDGKPAPGVAVTVVAGNRRFDKSPADLKLTTGADGGFTVKWPSPGFYWINATVEGGAVTVPRATRRASYTAILEVQKP